VYKLVKENVKNSHITNSEEKDIEDKISFEIVKSHHSMIKLGGVTNIIAGIFVVWTLYSQENTTLLWSWYVALVVASLVDILWANRYKYSDITPAKLNTWRKGFFVILAGLCLVWGSIGVLFISGGLQYQFYTIAFLLAVLIGFSFTAVTDFIIASISIACILGPTIFYRTFIGFQNLILEGHDRDLNVGISVSIFILATFLLIACYIGSKLVHKFFKLSFENVALSHKLENMNKFLEKRVKERTIDLENSLKLVTYQATHDLLTDLPNPRLLLEYLQSSIERANINHHLLGVAFFSINEIEKINEGLGHQAGDLIIKIIAQRLQNKFGQAGKNYNYDGTYYTLSLSRKDVFVILVEPLYKIEDIEKKADPLFAVLDEPVRIEKQTLKLTGSIGVSIYPRHGREIKSLLMNADAATLQAKQRGGNCLSIYKDEINADLSRQLEMESYLHTALQNKEFVLQYQPFVNIHTGLICGAEALVRWNNATLGFISPAEFIPLAEANGIILPLGEWVFRTACLQAKIWQQHNKSLKVAVNLSAKQLHQKNIIQMISSILTESDLSHENIELELTESEAFQNEVIPILKQFKVMGLCLSIDDFGTGYSGLSNLKLITIDKLKIDKSFVQDVVTNSDSRTIVENTISLAKKLGISVLAEGVETKEQLKFLKDNGCDMIQGFYFSPPINVDAFTELLISNKRFSVD
jgi:diguanylate cyclase (GGDEF)-like protein